MPTITPDFQPHPFLRGGHRQTVWATFRKSPLAFAATERHVVSVSDGDAVVLHDDRPPDWSPGKPSALLIHGLCGCHTANYMVRLAREFLQRGVRTFRLDMRGCGASTPLCTGITHAGRSDDVLAAFHTIAGLTRQGPLYAIGVSLGGNQLLRGLGELGRGAASLDFPSERLQAAAAVAPPVDLIRCSDHMDRASLRFYNQFFIRMLLQRMPAHLRDQSALADLKGRRPRTVRELDDQLTAPLAGFRDAADYYHQSAALSRLHAISIPTLVLTSEDDPIVPVSSFREAAWSDSTTLAITRHGGHVGYIGTKQQGNWMERLLVDWLMQQ